MKRLWNVVNGLAVKKKRKDNSVSFDFCCSQYMYR